MEHHISDRRASAARATPYRDARTSAIEGSIGAIPRRLMVTDRDRHYARRVLAKAGEAARGAGIDMRMTHGHISIPAGEPGMAMATAVQKRGASRRPTNVTLPASLISEAKQLGINISEACETGLRERVARARREQWLEENREAIDDYNARIERDGLTLAQHRRF